MAKPMNTQTSMNTQTRELEQARYPRFCARRLYGKNWFQKHMASICSSSKLYKMSILEPIKQFCQFWSR